MQYEKDGNTYEFSIDLDRIADMEEADPDFDMMSIFDNIEKGEIKFSTLRKIANFVGTDFKDMKAKGLNLADLTSILSGCIEEMGFTSDVQEQDTSSPTAD